MSRRHGLIRFAHRGASSLAPENTIAAFREAVRLGCEWVETDLRLSADGEPILLHDPTVDRTTNGRGAVSAMSLARIRRLDAGGAFSSAFRGEKIPTLDEAIEFGRGRCGLNLEIKEEDRVEDLVEAIARRVKRHAALDRILFSSFRTRDLLRIRAFLPRARLGWLVSRGTRGLTALVARAAPEALHPKDRLVSTRLLRRCRALGLAVHVWVVNREPRLRELEALGVDGVMTDDPRIFLRNGASGARRDLS